MFHKDFLRGVASSAYQIEEQSMKEIRYTDFVRLGREICVEDDKFDAFITYLKKYKNSIKEITFFDGYFHSVPVMEVYEEFAEKFQQRLPILHEMGIKVGINHFLTVGFFEQGGDKIFRDGQFLVRPDGSEVVGRLCFTHETTMEYIKKAYSIIAKLNPDFIYSDDDLSFMFYGICRCDNCISQFEEQSHIFTNNNMEVSRENLEILLREQANKESFIDFSISNVKKIYSLIEKTVHAQNPEIELGFMPCTYLMKKEIELYTEVQSAGKNTIRMRPGEGLYNDKDVAKILDKAARISQQIVNAPKEITKIEAELECFPNQPLAKSAKFYTFECLNYLAHGCTGLAHSIFNAMYGFADYEDRFDMLENIRRYGQGFVDIFGKSPCCGVSYLTGFSDKDCYYKKCETPKLYLEDIMLAGIPFTANTDHADVFVLTKENVDFLTDDEIVRAFEKSVFMTGEALEQLNARGFGEYTGFEILDVYPLDTRERDLDSKFNIENGVNHTVRDGAQSFCWFPEYSKAYSIKSNTGEVEYITELIDFEGKHRGYSLAVGYNAYGNKVAVSGYYPVYFGGALSRQHQLREVFKWLSKAQVKAVVKSLGKITLVQRQLEGGQGVILLNYSLDDALGVKVVLKDCNAPEVSYTSYCNGEIKEQTIKVGRINEKEVEIIIPKIPTLSCGYFTW